MPCIFIMPATAQNDKKATMEMYKVVELIQPVEFKFKYPFVVYKYVKNGQNKPIYTAYKQFRKQEQAYEFIASKRV